MKQLKRLKGMKKFPEDKKRKIVLAKPVEGDRILDLTDELVSEIWARFDKRPSEYKTSVRCAKLYRELFTTYEGTIPEVIIYDWLTRKNEPFEFQPKFFGGRSAKGGVIPDFMVWPGGRGLAWFCDTLYWHTKPEIMQSDLADRVKLVGQWYQGVRVEQVISIWENRVYDDRNTVLEWALQGIEAGR